MAAVADPGFACGGDAKSLGREGRQHMILPKQHEIERVWTPGDGGASLVPPLGSATAQFVKDTISLEVCTEGNGHFITSHKYTLRVGFKKC